MHNHSHHGHSHGHETAHFNKLFAIAVTFNLLYVILEVGYGFAANSMSLLADAVHNFGDVIGLILSWFANWLLSFPPKKRYSYGFKRVTVIASLINALLLVATSALIAYESILKLMHLNDVNENIVIVIGMIGIIVNGGSSLLFMKGASDDLNIRSAFWHQLADALILIGVVVSATIISYTGWEWIDPAMGLVIVAIVLWGTWGLMRDSVHLILDATPRYIDRTGVNQYLEAIPGVETIHDVHIWGLSTREVALTAHLVIPNGKLTDADYFRINKELRDRFSIDHATIQVEDGSDTDPCHRTHTC